MFLHRPRNEHLLCPCACGAEVLMGHRKGPHSRKQTRSARHIISIRALQPPPHTLTVHLCPDLPQAPLLCYARIYTQPLRAARKCAVLRKRMITAHQAHHVPLPSQLHSPNFPSLNHIPMARVIALRSEADRTSVAWLNRIQM